MPLYEYRCRGCGHRFEVLQRMGAGADGVSCPSCESEETAKQLSTFAGSSSGATESAGMCGPRGGDAGCGSGGFT